MATDLTSLGFKPWFRSQVDQDATVARVFAVHRTGVNVRGEVIDGNVPLGGRWFQVDAEARPTVGDWVVLDPAGEGVSRVLERSSLLKRMHPGKPRELQLLAANVDLLLIVTSCNEDFNPSRLERYLTLGEESGIRSLVVITKADLAEDAERYAQSARELQSDLEVVPLNAKDPASVRTLLQWCSTGDTVALVGSSGVGKSTLLNALAGDDLQRTGAIREDDGKGRHTTTHRSLHVLPSGVLVVDSPGIRELGLVDVEEAVDQFFEEIELLSSQCRFNDCAHESEPGCAIQAAIESGQLEARRLESYRKLLHEDEINRESVAQRNARMRRFSKVVKSAKKKKP